MSENTKWYADGDYWMTNRGFIWPEKRLSNSARDASAIAELLEMKKGQSVLDLACGFGRHALEFMKLGLRVTGVDLNPDLLQEAGEAAKSVKGSARFVCMDMREYNAEEEFDYIVNLYNSFGYFEDQSEDDLVLRNCRESLVPGGSILISTTGREFIEKHMPGGTSRYWHGDNGTYRLEESNFESETGWLTTEWILIENGEERSYKYGRRIYSEGELVKHLEKAGFTNVKTYGGVGGKPYSSESHRLVAAGKK
ncbi:MAG: methyltransferase domain-containing protein [Candidatus Aegiribacteria sp.]|nr:methyltransferase domain-containing protein [Candidatus Aegiribacteria sp.]MBD3295284.1 methyltransferase domain-containing protein [Candidatus Fermentibacteria bacterium]